MSANEREYLPTFAELVDRLTVDQIREVLLPQNPAETAEELRRLEHDMDLIAAEQDLRVTARFVRKVVVLAQINLHIWRNKDEMQRSPEKYDELLRMAHQLNGIRNRIKNSLMDDVDSDALRHSNTETDSLDWKISI